MTDDASASDGGGSADASDADASDAFDPTDTLVAAQARYEDEMNGVVASPTGDTSGSQVVLAPGVSPVAPNLEHPLLLKRRGPVSFHDCTGAPLVAAPYLIVVNGKATTGVTDTAGWIEAVDPSASAADVTIGDSAYHLIFAAPSGDVAIAQSALNALGYSAGPLDGQLGVRTRVALASYQGARGLTVTGEADAATLAALKADHVVEDWRSPP
jgi:hypothetical protein